MIKVEKVEKEKLKYIVNDYTCPSYSSIAAGIASGQVWVDEIDMPKLALVYSEPVGGFEILGKSKHKEDYIKLCEFLKHDLFPKLKEEGINEFEVSIDVKESEDILLELWKEKKLSSEMEFTYQRIIPYELKEEIVPAGYSFYPVDKEFLLQLSEQKIKDDGLLVPHLLNAWGSYEAFLEKGIAFVAVYNQEVAAFVLGSAYYYKKYTIDIETSEAHRNKGLALYLTKLFTNECVKHGYVAQWNYTDSNTASAATVKAAKYLYIKQHRYYWFAI